MGMPAAADADYFLAFVQATMGQYQQDFVILFCEFVAYFRGVALEVPAVA